MYNYSETSDYVVNSLHNVWNGVADFLPRFIIALIVFLVGWLLAVFIAKAVWHLVKFLQIDRGLESLGFRKAWERSGHKLDTPLFFYELVKWAIIIGFLMAATDILGLTKVTDFLLRVLYYLPNIFIAAIVLIIGVLVARFVESLVRGSVKAAELHAANFLGTLVRWVVLVFSFLIALNQLGIGKDVIGDATKALFYGIAAAFALAFGLGGKDHADQVLSNWRKKIQD